MPERGKDYPGSYAELRAWFPDDTACLDYLDWLRWPDGFACPHCGDRRSWRLRDGRRSCGGCSRRVSATAGTIFDRTRTPLTIWFLAAWHITSQKNGISALGLGRVLGIGSYQTAWALLHRYRSAMIRPGRDRLAGTVEVDETAVGGVKPGKRGRGAAGKTLAAIAVEQKTPRGFGRARITVVPNARADTLRRFLLEAVEPGSTVLTDGLASYRTAVGSEYVHEPLVIAGSDLDAHVHLPGVHRVASLAKRWLLGTHQGAVEPEHLQAYLDEFTFRFNRRSSRARGLLFYRLLEQSVVAGPVRYRELVAVSRPKAITPTPPPSRRVRPGSLATTVPPRVWRR